MIERLLMVLVPQAVKDALAQQSAQIAELQAWKQRVEAVWPQIVEEEDGAD